MSNYWYSGDGILSQSWMVLGFLVGFLQLAPLFCRVPLDPLVLLAKMDSTVSLAPSAHLVPVVALVTLALL